MNEATKIVEELEGRKVRIVCAKGDLYPAVNVLRRLYKQAGYELYDKNGRVITGEEDEEGKPDLIYTKLHRDPFVVLRPQNFSELLSREEPILVVGAGYDIEMDDFLEMERRTDHNPDLPPEFKHKLVDDFRLNGSLEDPKTREAIMMGQIKMAGLKGVDLKFKPTITMMIASTRWDICTLYDVPSGPGVSELRALSEMYMIKKGEKATHIQRIPRGADTRVIGGLNPCGTDIVESGNTLDGYLKKGEIRVVRDGKGKPAVVTRSHPFMLVSDMTYRGAPEFYDGLFALSAEIRDKLIIEGVLGTEEKFLPFMKSLERAT